MSPSVVNKLADNKAYLELANAIVAIN